ncbi:MAG: sel1 repeat family protein [Myxococcota bacterium]|nr:sel1 repeat family protein [Myxococcota bacterium]
MPAAWMQAFTTSPLRLRSFYPLIGVLAVLVACRKDTPSSGEHPAASASIVTIGVALGTCEDVPVCEKECSEGSADRCRRLAATYASGKGVTRDEARAAALYEGACRMNDAPSCVFAGQSREYAHGVAKDDAEAARLYERACELKWPAGCYNLAIMLESGRGVARDGRRANELYQLACAAGAKQSCDKARQERGPPSSHD